MPMLADTAPSDRESGFWFSTPNAMAAEIAAMKGFRRAVLDLEHGAFDQQSLDIFIPLCRQLGLQVLAKVVGPHAEAIQQALDFGSDGVVIPHVLGVEHARSVCVHAMYPPLGDRSFAGGRIVAYGAAPKGFFRDENRRIICLPMIESAAALADIEAILALEAVSGVFVGPTDLALSRGRTHYEFGDDDKADIGRIARSARAAGKPWIMPAWSASERAFAREHGADWMVVLDEQGAFLNGVDTFLARFTQEGRGS